MANDWQHWSFILVNRLSSVRWQGWHCQDWRCGHGEDFGTRLRNGGGWDAGLVSWRTAGLQGYGIVPVPLIFLPVISVELPQGCTRDAVGRALHRESRHLLLWWAAASPAVRSLARSLAFSVQLHGIYVPSLSDVLRHHRCRYCSVGDLLGAKASQRPATGSSVSAA
jgi:hypothetical protein